MRARNIKPSFFKNEDLAEIEPLGRILFQGLWCMADREGRLEDRPKRIKAEILPYDSANINRLLNELHNRNFIIRYSVNGSNFIMICNFKKHQYPHLKEPQSTIPEPDLNQNCTMQPDKHQESTIPEPDLNGANSPESPILNPESIPPLPPKGGSDVSFEKFWKAYPKKVGKKAALNSWRKAKGKPDISAIILAIERQKISEQWQKDDGQFIPLPTTWLNQGRWDDEPNTSTNIQPIKPFRRPCSCGSGKWEDVCCGKAKTATPGTN